MSSSGRHERKHDNNDDNDNDNDNDDDNDRALYISRLRELEEACKVHFEDIGCHGWEHVARVRSLSRTIGEKEGADLAVLDVAALFHDTMRSSEDHSARSAEYAEQTLAAMGFSNDFRAAVYSAISAHSFSAGRAAEILEAKVLSDADRLDAMGAIGIYRTAQYNLEHGYRAERVGEHIREKLNKLQELLHTRTARAMGLRRQSILGLYLRALEEELADSSSSK
jgi:uncharacterized protein